MEFVNNRIRQSAAVFLVSRFFFFFADVTLNVSTPGKLKNRLTAVGIEPATIIIINVYPTEINNHVQLHYKL